MLALSIGGVSRILVDLVDLPVNFSADYSVDFWVRVSVDCLPVGFDLSVGLDRVDMAISPFLKIRCSANDLYIYRLSIAMVAR